MEARDGPGRIRPLPPEQPESAAPEPAGPGRDRRWIPLAIVGAALALFAVGAAVFDGVSGGSGSSRRSAADTTIPSIGGDPPPTTTTTTVPPLLGERVPDLIDSMRVVFNGPGEATTSEVTWDIDADAPGPPTTSGLAASGATFDASREELLSITSGRRDTMWIGAPPDAEPVFVGVSGAAWHPSSERALAWVGRPFGGSRHHLYRATAGASVGLDDVTDLGPIPERSRLVGWGDWGFVLHVDAPLEFRQWELDNPEDPERPRFQRLDFTLLLDPRGAIRAAFAAQTHAVGATGHLVVSPTTDAYAAARAAGLDPDALGLGEVVTVLPPGPAGEPVIVLEPDLAPSSVAFDPATASTSYAFTPDGSHVSAMGLREGRFTVETRSVVRDLQRITSIEAADRFVGHTRNGSLLIIYSTAEREIVFHDWNRGATFRVPFRLGNVLAVDVAAIDA